MDLQKILNFDFVKSFLNQYPNAKIFLVGGAVRDYFLGVESCDFDFVVEGISWDELIKYLEKHGRVIWVEGRTFGTIKFMPNQNSNLIIDFAIPRSERYMPGMRRKNAEIELGKATITDDLARRDFTINAMAIDLRLISKSEFLISNQCQNYNDKCLGINNLDLNKNLKFKIKNFLVDPFGGLVDIENKLIRAVGDPCIRFTEDPTRILRGVRFAAKFDFRIEDETLKAMQELKGEIIKKFINEKNEPIERVSWEVIGQEFMKTLDTNPRRCIDLYDKVGLLSLIFPEIEVEKGVEQPYQYHSEGDVFTHTKMSLAALKKSASLKLKVATLLHDIGKPGTFTPVSVTGDRIRFNNHDNLGAEISKNILTRLKLPNKFIDDVVWLIKNHMRVIFAFPKMRIEKKKNFARNDLIPELLDLVRADTLASIDENGQTFIASIEPIVDKIIEMRDKELSRPSEIISGVEIINIIKELDGNFDEKREGKVIGALKKNINNMYNKEEIRTKTEAKERIRKWAKRKVSRHPSS